MRLLMVFLDGVGIGPDDPRTNPLVAARLPALRSLLGGKVPTLNGSLPGGPRTALVSVDATLGVEGLPQSGTGQTALLTGENGAKMVGKHFGPYPYSTLRPLLADRSIFRRVREAGLESRFANAFPQRYFDYIERRPTRVTAITYAAVSSGVPLLRAESLADGNGISADITAEGWRGMGYAHVEPIPPRESGRRLARLLDRFHFVLFEYWKTDHAGHSENFAEAVDALQRLDGLLEGVVTAMDPDRDLLVITSDHGNVEDMSTKSHTRNPVPALFHGHGAHGAAERLAGDGRATTDLTHVTPLLVDLLGAAPAA